MIGKTLVPIVEESACLLYKLSHYCHYQTCYTFTNFNLLDLLKVMKLPGEVLYSPWGHKESDRTEFHILFFFLILFYF